MSYLRRVRLTDDHNVGRLDFVGKQWVVQPIRTHGATFIGTTIDTNFWTAATSGTGAAATQTAGLLTMGSGTDNNGRATLSSVRSGRFIFFHPIFARIAARIPTLAVAQNTRRLGAFSHTNGAPVNGYYFEISPTGALSVKAVNESNVTLNVASGAFNGRLGSSYILDTNVHAFEIHYFVMHVDFFIDGEILHSATPTTANLTGSYMLPLSAVTLNSASGVTSGPLEIWAANAMRSGPDVTLPRNYYHAAGTTAGTVLKRGAGQIHGLTISQVSNNAVVTIHDNTAASGTVIWTSGAMGANTVPFNVDLRGSQFETGLTLVVSGANASVVVIYE